jgi:hypothetical protein
MFISPHITNSNVAAVCEFVNQASSEAADSDWQCSTTNSFELYLGHKRIKRYFGGGGGITQQGTPGTVVKAINPFTKKIQISELFKHSVRTAY